MAWRLVRPTTERHYAEALARQFTEFGPEYVVYLERGGRVVGQVIASYFGIPQYGIEICYPLSPLWNTMPRASHIFTWPLKELIYQLGRPSLRQNRYPDICGRRLALVDDSASSGRSMALAIKLFGRLGVPREEMRTGVIRCGRRAVEIIDCYVSTEQMLFARR